MNEIIPAIIFYFCWCLFIAFIFGVTLATALIAEVSPLWAAFIGLITYGSHFMLWALAALVTDSQPPIAVQHDLSTLKAQWRASLPRLIVVASMLVTFNAAWFLSLGVSLLQASTHSDAWLLVLLAIVCWMLVFGPNQLKILQRCRDGCRGVQLHAQANTLHVVSWERGQQLEHHIGLAGLEVKANNEGIQLVSGDQQLTLMAAAPEDSAQLITALQALSQSAQPTGSQQDIPSDLRTLTKPQQSP